jgi:3-oxoacyl-[acyl-carrier protein] reductase
MMIAGQSVLITGGCGSIGLEIARQFLLLGKTVTVCDLKTDAASSQIDEKRFRSIACDLSDESDIEAKLKPVFGSNDAPDILVNAVGIAPKHDAAGHPLTIDATNGAMWRKVFATNVDAYFFCSQLAIPKMRERMYGRIINIGSYVARTGGRARNSVAYVTSKAAVLGLTKSMARELGGTGITVNAINPGRIASPMNADASGDETREFLKLVPAGRVGQALDVAGAALYLASDAASYVTGAALEVNGGLYMGA